MEQSNKIPLRKTIVGIVAPLVGIFSLVVIGLYLSLLLGKMENPRGYKDFFVNILGVRPVTKISRIRQVFANLRYFLSEEEKVTAEELGLDPEVVARASWVSQWMQGKGCNIGRGALISFTGHESAYCTNCGHFDACNEYDIHPKLNGEKQCAALDKFLALWKQYDIRNPSSEYYNPRAAEYINASYTAAQGSKGGGALGCSQFLAGTAWPHCASGMVSEPCDLWDEDTAMMFMGAELCRLGWDEDLSIAGKIKVGVGWNQDSGWISQVVSAAKRYMDYLGVQKGLAQLDKSASTTTEVEWIKPPKEETVVLPEWLLKVLNFLQLLPKGFKIEKGLLVEEIIEIIKEERVDSLPVNAEGAVVLDLNTETPNGDGEDENILEYAKRHPVITLPPQGQNGSIFNLCQNDNLGSYPVAAGYHGGGICFNASMMRAAAEMDSRLRIIAAPKETRKDVLAAWPRHTTAIKCMGATFIIENTSAETVSLVWGYDPEKRILSLSVEPSLNGGGETDGE